MGHSEMHRSREGTRAGIFAIPYCSLPLDGILGIFMAVYIFISGMESFRENLGLLLGEGLSRKTEDELRKVLSECAEIESVEALSFHDYGPAKKVVVAEVSFAESSDKETRRRRIDHVIQFCRYAMGIELSLYDRMIY